MELNKLKVVELASVLAGPAVGMFFAELGAEVTKIENPTTGGDVTRTWKLPTESAQTAHSAYYCSINWGKKVVFADLSQPTDRQKVYELIAEADIVITNYKTGDDKKLGVDYATLAALNPQLIYGQITAFGETDPRVGYDMVLQAETGFMYMNGDANGNPVKLPVALIDILTAHQLKEALLLAIIKRMQTGKGSFVTVSLFDSAIASLANQATNWLIGNTIPQRMGSLHPNIAPYGETFVTADHKTLVLAVGSDRQFFYLCKLLNLNHLCTDARFSTNAQRVTHRQLLQNLLMPEIAKLSSQLFLQKCTELQVPAAEVRNMQSVFEQSTAKKMLLSSTMPDGTIAKCVRTIAFEV